MASWVDISADPKMLNAAQQKMVQRLETYDMSFVFEKLKMDGKININLKGLLEREFKRFVALAGFGVCPLAMIGPMVDEIWHQFILFTKQYRDFCWDTVGLYIDHQPDIPSMPLPVVAGENFRSQYKFHFGTIPGIWFEGMSEETRSYYLQPVLIGKPPSSWSGWTGPHS
jgi:hypothetical protein